jgi:hypothetical protein
MPTLSLTKQHLISFIEFVSHSQPGDWAVPKFHAPYVLCIVPCGHHLWCKFMLLQTLSFMSNAFISLDILAASCVDHHGTCFIYILGFAFYISCCRSLLLLTCIKCQLCCLLFDFTACITHWSTIEKCNCRIRWWYVLWTKCLDIFRFRSTHMGTPPHDECSIFIMLHLFSHSPNITAKYLMYYTLALVESQLLV